MTSDVQHHWPAHGWRSLHGDFERDGLSIESHDFRAEQPLAWGETFRPQSIEFCLNSTGRAAVGKNGPCDYISGTAGYYSLGTEPLPATRRAHDRHQFVTFEFSRPYLQKQLAASEDDLEPLVRRAVFSDKNTNVVAVPRTMTSDQRNLVAGLLQPPVAKAAQVLWYQAKATELIAHFLFEPKDPELFCMRQKRVARDRVERTKELLARDLANPPTLESLGQEVGCSPFHLSRIFSREVGLTIPQFLRNLRMERAAELLRSGRYNVTEAAMEVGYASLSHFSKAFCETIGCCPALYPMAKHVVLDR
ncbi:MAG: helix-turn-helix transcriptional regulator [Chthoniobacterales bacterium]